ncbi:hypothetical protein Tco_1446381 [Tanacetum coccineum]
MNSIHRSIAAHRLYTYPHVDPKVKEDEEKSAFHTDYGVYCYTKMSFGLKSAGATYVDAIFKGQIRVNLEANVDDMVIKSKTGQDIIIDVEETLIITPKMMKRKAVKKMVKRRISKAIEEYEKTRENTDNVAGSPTEQNQENGEVQGCSRKTFI